jgi:hypothetical protein
MEDNTIFDLVVRPCERLGHIIFTTIIDVYCLVTEME